MSPNHDEDSYAIATAMASRWLAAYCAQAPDAGDMLEGLTADRRASALALGALAEMHVALLTKLDRDGAIEGGVQLFLDRQALNFGAAADAVVNKYNKGQENG
jgi:hypothetical protein